MTIRVLHVIDGMGSGGAESFIMNIYRHIDREKVQFDFLLRHDEDMYYGEIKELGGKIFLMPSFPKQVMKNYIETKKFLKENQQYKIIHIHANALIYMGALILAKKLKIPVRIMHSHNTKTKKPIYRFFHDFNKLFADSLTTDNFACSNAAGKWMFKNKNYKLINNGINVDDFTYSETYRNKIREEFNMENKFVIGHIGRFLYSKNHEFLIDVFKSIYDQNNNAVLVMVGTGPQEHLVRDKVKRLGLIKNVIFTGVRNDVNKLLQAFDIFIFPSYFEGLGIVLVEAQASGLHCIASDRIPIEAKVTPLLEFLSLDKPVKQWAEVALKYQNGYTRENKNKVINDSGYDIREVARKLENYYLQAFMGIK